MGLDRVLNKMRQVKDDPRTRYIPYGHKGVLNDGTPSKISTVCDSLKDLLLYKNKLYGDAALNPVGVFYKGSAEASILCRLDDKIKRIQTSQELRKNDVSDLMGYLVLLAASKGWLDFSEFKD